MTGGALVVGASQAGVQLAVSLRRAGYRGPVTLVGAENHPPYQRPPLSKAFLTGKADATTLHLRTPEFYREHGIDLVTGERVTHLEVDADGAGRARTAGGRTLPFDRLALATGARPRRLEVPGAHLDGVLHLRDLDSATRLRQRLTAGATLVVVGGGFIGLETAAVASALGAKVTVVEAAGRAMSRVVAPAVSAFFQEAHARRGVEVRLGAAVAEFLGGQGRITGVALADGTVLPAETVVVGIGVVPRTDLATDLDLACDGGVLVDACGRTSRPSIVAAGDCVAAPHPTRPGQRIRLESVPAAIAQARAAGATLAGQPQPNQEVPWFWSDQFDLKLQMAGLTDGYDRHVLRGDPGDERFSVLYYRSGSFVAIHSVNAPADYVAGRAALARGASIPPEPAADPTRSLRSLITPTAAVPAAQ
ncbi:FAD-dependent oxidoreductase [Phytohabitans sp. ZYX-F-186]|uniref:FAD-dependent oxidoreductase n=1 Tax=Phytohabitans maris TaxID=3071409 RepID=A0ABU0ZPC8_9ACTN|nr:FAD-dependent oxidoreductase [Phytohabitans sp. ZYX-F-186]MDQ7908894.1 FAD-dependent oxidoreductase [Phytohabitans sp. ZYX-F-186]